VSTEKTEPVVAEEVGANDPIPFSAKKFKALIGLDSDQHQNILVDVAITELGMLNGAKNNHDPAVYAAWWLKDRWPSLVGLMAHEYNQMLALDAARHNLRALQAAKDDAPTLLGPDGKAVN
jgi:hypothetical protein